MAIDGGWIVERGAVLGDVERQRPVVAAQAREHLVQAVGPDLPAHRGRRRLGLRLAGLQRQLAGSGGDALRVVVVDAEEVDRGADHREVAVANRFGRAVQPFVEAEHVGRVAPAQHRVQEPAVQMAVHAPGGVTVGLARRSRGETGTGSARSRSARARRAARAAPAAPGRATTADDARRAARSASGGSPAPWSRTAWPRKATTHGSLWVIHCETASPSSAATSAAYSAKRSAVSRSPHPPESCSACGRSQ